MMKKLAVVFFAGCLLFLSASAAWAPCGVSGYVYCDVNQNGIIDEGDTPFANVDVMLDGVYGATTNAEGFYDIFSYAVCHAETISLDETTLPDDAVFIDPPINGAPCSSNLEQNWLIDSEVCHPTEEGECWLTAGGVKFEPVVGIDMAQHTNTNGHGPKDSVGGVVYPSCDPDPGDGGNWNHIFHKAQWHLKGTDITVIRCGNVEGIEPGTESPECPLNFIEFEGTGTLDGIGGNKANCSVRFSARAEDRNEPGNERSNPNGGADIDRYFLQVFDAGTNALLLEVSDENGDPITITGGNFQIHCSSCE
jgi:hypothetical protein